MKAYVYLSSLCMCALLIVGCANPYNNQGEGAGLGGVLGAVAGGIIGHQSHDAAAGMLIGGALGAAGGAVVGSQIPKDQYQYPAAVAAQPAPFAMTPTPSIIYTQEGATVNVPNDTGGYTAVMLKRSGNGFIGPQGEYYPQIPEMSQLKAMYGR